MASFTTGPISSSSGMDRIRIEVLNNTSSRKTSTVRLYDLSFTPKRRLIRQSLSLAGFATGTIDVPASNIQRWEVQVTAPTTSVRLWAAGQINGQNLPGNTIINSEWIQYS
ncbi:MAG TPA: hypothetical protein VFC73_07000 [Syntrophomonadaceae bacterium]|nr:hypothetical protein [Syntrophomonadaceae bacterium]